MPMMVMIEAVDRFRAVIEAAPPCPTHGRDYLAVCVECERVACAHDDHAGWPCQCDNDE